MNINTRYLLLIVIQTLFLTTACAGNHQVTQSTKKLGNEAIVQGIYDGFAKGTCEENLVYMADDVIWAHPVYEEIPFARVFKGHDGVREFFEQAIGSLNVLDQQLYKLVSDGDTVVAIGSERMEVKATGLEYFTPWTHVFTFEDGKIARFDEYVDTAAMINAFTGR
jgi:ketosteroid isomerase-like protein